MNLADSLQQHLVLCEEIHSFFLEENRILQTTRRPPSTDFLNRKSELLPRLDAARLALSIGKLTQEGEMSTQKVAIDRLQKKMLSLLLLDRENEKLLLKCSMQADAFQVAAKPPRADGFPRLLCRCRLIMAASDPSSLPLPGSTYRLVVNSAEEAVRMIHEKLGAEARVISVKQIGAKGFAGLLRAPQLEVIAEIPAAGAHPAPVVPAPPAAPVPPFPEIPLPASSIPEDEAAWLQEDPLPPAVAAKNILPLERLLSRGGLSEQILTRLRRSPQWEPLSQRPLGEALKEVVEILRAQWHESPERALGARVAFFGPPGSGATTALCKALTMDVFFRSQPAVVMKLDGEQPNPTEGLAMFCEALKVPLIRSADDLEQIPEGNRFYFDATGSPLHDGAAWRDLGRLLGEFYIESRVLVLNAAYDVGLLKRAYTLGYEAGATHVVFTHLDEVHHWGKLWDLLLSGGLQPLFFSCGQNVSGELREDTFEQMAQRILGGLG